MSYRYPVLDATLAMANSTINVMEGGGSVDVCVQITGIDSIECVVTGSLISVGTTKAGLLPFARNLMYNMYGVVRNTTVSLSVTKKCKLYSTACTLEQKRLPLLVSIHDTLSLLHVFAKAFTMVPCTLEIYVWYNIA